MAIDTKTIAALRSQTGAGLADCKKALEEVGGDMDKAVEALRKSGAAKAAKKSAERTTKAGLVGSYIHGEGRIGALVKVACETDFVAKNDDFKELVTEVAMQVAAMAPQYVSPENIPEDVILKEKEIYSEQLKAEGKPENIWEKIIEGKLKKFYEDVCLLNQTYMKDDSKTINDLVAEAIAKTGEKIEVIEIARFQV
jgi:elongation factor Ts